MVVLLETEVTVGVGDTVLTSMHSHSSSGFVLGDSNV